MTLTFKKRKTIGKQGQEDSYANGNVLIILKSLKNLQVVTSFFKGHNRNIVLLVRET